MNLEHLIRNQFENITASIDRRELFFSGHLNSMIGNTLNGALDPIIEESNLVHQMWNNKVFHRKYITGEGKGSTIVINNLIEELLPVIRNLETTCILKWNKKSARYTEGFPSGLSEYTRATRSKYRSLINRLELFSQKYETELGNDFFVKFKNFGIRWDQNTAIKDDIKQDIKESSPDFEAIWKVVATQLYKNALTILLASLDNRRIVMSYFDFSIINPRHHASDDATDAAYKLLIPALTSKAAEISFSVDDTLLIINNGVKSIFYYGAATADEEAKTALIEIPSGEEVEVTAASLGAPTNKFIIFVNKDATEEVEVEIALI
jgi:hypothetical protein